ncbi:glucose-6-phosphate dehydrogenase [Marilutibacter maris]|uniref:Glucose-6-phosphate 1-dehydrogenase n=1 Tax=Marilutibacter maris TaxID=1605891 RepID=A0A2U9TD72_9GAMM|nr:glucose-6-phosphate dehydrogenase [Lysobacter maris]AWV08814.1 glucose-6-phosphate dehydrogenase [Lysobacter maris]
MAPFDLVIFGGTGDLAMRKLLPALLHRFVDGQIGTGTRIYGVARDARSDEAYRGRVREAVAGIAAADPRVAEAVDAFLALLHYRQLDLASEDGWPAFAEEIGHGPDRVRVFYLAVGPSLFANVADRLASVGLAGGGTRVVVEKPIGKDGASAQVINEALGRVFEESQVFRIDHYLGKETVQNLTALRFGNALFEPLWKAEHIDHVQITVAETVGVEGRAAYYDKSGALRDMVQNHLLQLLCLVAMEPPASLAADAIRDEKLKVLRALRPIGNGNASQMTVRGQYRAGAVDGQAVPGYLDELGGPSHTETFVAIKAEVQNWRWAGVPFYLRTGKRLAERMSEIVVTFRRVPHSIFGDPADGSASPLAPNKLVIRLQPDEGVKLWLMNKVPGPGGMRMREVAMDLSFAETFGGRQPDAYERLLMDVVRGNPMLFMRRDEVDAAWQWIDPIRAAWEAGHDAPKPYTAGGWGPSAAVALIERDGRTWHEDAQ